MALILNRNKVIIACLSLLIYFVLEYTFEHIIWGNYFEFEKFKSGDSELWIHILGYLIPIGLTLFLVILPVTELIYCVLCLLVVLVIYPTSILWSHLNSDPRIILLYVLYFLIVFLASISFKVRLALPQIKERQKTLFFVVLSVLLITPFVFIYAPHINFQNFALTSEVIYESRDLETSLSNPYTGYVYSQLSNVILPLLLLLATLHKEYLKAVAAFAMLIFMFLVGGHKSVFFGAFLVAYFFIGTYLTKVKIFFFGLLLFLLASIVVHHFTNDFFLVSLFARRIFFLPAILEIGYFDFFDKVPIYWSDSILSNFVAYPFDLSTRNLIGRHVLGNVITNANNGIVSDGFMNFGIVGSLINILLVSFVYAILNSLNLSHRFFGLIFLLFFTFMSSYFFTSMVTHGGLLLLILAYISLRNSHQLYDR